MNYRRPPLMLVLALSTLGGGCPAEDKPPPPLQHAPAAPVPVRRAQLKGLHGDVKVKRAAGDDWLPAQEDMPLFENDKVRTVAGAGAQVVFTQGSMVSLGEDALISIAEARREAQEMLRRNQQEVEKFREELMAKSRKEADEFKASAQREIEDQKAKAIAQVRAMTVDLAVEVAGKLLNERLDDSKHRALAEQFVQSLPAKPGTERRS